MLKVLIIDDSKVMRRLLQSAVGEAAGRPCEFVEAADGELALEELEKRSWAFDIVFCDLIMPNLDGLGFLGQVESRGKAGFAPVVMVTGDAAEDQAKQALQRGAKELVGKPFSASSLREILARLLPV